MGDAIGTVFSRMATMRMTAGDRRFRQLR